MRDDLSPERNAHPFVIRAYRIACSVRGLWLEHFGLPSTDPRYQEATEDDLMRDMLVAMYRAGATRRAHDPDSALLEQVEKSRGEFEAINDRLERALEPDGILMRQILAFEASRLREQQEMVGPITSVRPKRAEEE